MQKLFSMQKMVFLILLFCLANNANVWGQTLIDPFAPLRIGLLKLGYPGLFYLIPSDGKIEIFNEKARQPVYSGPAKVVLARSDNQNGMQVFVDNILQSHTRDPLIFSPIGKPPHHIWIGSQPKLQKAYRASIMVFPAKNRLGAVNIIPMDEYLRSVVPSEIGNSCPFPALAAQAVAARTYAFRNLPRHSRHGFNLCDDVHCQAYNGLLREHPASTQSVEATRGIVLMFDGRFANTVYHSTCGGRLYSCNAVWGGKPVPYLVEHDDKIGNSPAFCSWAIKKSAPEKINPGSKDREDRTMVVPKTSQVVTNPGKNRTIKIIQNRPAKTSPSGRFAGTPPSPDGSNPKIKTGLVFPGGKISTPISFLKTSRGHRVGMCQDGAVGMSRQGYSAHDILSFYYPHTTLLRIDPSMKGLSRPEEPPRLAAGSKTPPTPPSPDEGSSVDRSNSGDNSRGSLKLTAGKKSRDFRKWYWCNIPVKVGMKIKMAAFGKPAKKTKPGKIALAKSKKKIQKT